LLLLVRVSVPDPAFSMLLPLVEVVLPPVVTVAKLNVLLLDERPVLRLTVSAVEVVLPL
jgi:hypothetical protein